MKCWRPACIAGLLFVAAGCGGGGERGSGTATTATDAGLIGATTTVSAAAAPTTTSASAAPKGVVDEAMLKRAALALSDLTPGFAEDPPFPDEPAVGVCGKPTVSSRVPYATMVRVRFSKGTLGPFVQERLASFREIATAQQFMSTVRSDAACQSYKEGADEKRLAALNVGSFGDETVAFRVTGNATADVVYVRIGSVVIQVGVAGLVIESDLTVAAVTKATQKARILR